MLSLHMPTIFLSLLLLRILDTGEDPPLEIREESFLPTDRDFVICHLTHDQLFLLWHQRMGYMHYNRVSQHSKMDSSRVR